MIGQLVPCGCRHQVLVQRVEGAVNLERFCHRFSEDILRVLVLDAV